MAFRQFPATGGDGESYVIIEFKNDPDQADADDAPRYELADGRPLIRNGRQFSTRQGELTLSIG